MNRIPNHDFNQTGKKMNSFKSHVLGLLVGLSATALFSQAPADSGLAPAAPKPAGLTAKGGGVFINSEDGRGVIRFMGYAQPVFMLTAESNKQAYKVPTFFVRRARADFKAEYDSLYTLFFEFDAGTAAGTSLVEGYTQAALIKDHLNFRLGKYIQPFSAENLRSSRALETVERFQALNTLIGLPAFDANIGAMLFGTVDAGKTLKYYLSVNNGTNTAAQGGNVKDGNSDKDMIARLEFAPNKMFKLGAAYDYDKEKAQTLAMKSYSGAVYDSLRVYGARHAVDVDAHAVLGKLGLDAEWLMAMFPDTNAAFQGGYAQVAYWVKGSEAEGGWEPLFRAEYSKLSADNAPPEVDGCTMMAFTLGVNWWANQWARWQVNIIEETTSGKGNAVYAAKDGKFLPTAFAEFQIKF
ncbi:MAG: porin [Fibrobacteria bacterium]